MTIADLPYRDPQPLRDLMALTDADYQNQLGGNWTYVEDLLHQYIPADIELVQVPLGFAGPMTSCLRFHGVPACREYMSGLIGIMTSKAPTT